jgi:peptidylprolyl isomerase
VSGNDTIARVGGTEIKEDDLRIFIAGLGEREQAALSRDPALLSQVVRQLLANHLILKEALAKRWDERPDIAEQLKRAREISIVESYLRSISQPPADFPGETTIQSVYDANRSAFLVPRQFLIGQIFVAQSNDADKAIAAKATKKVADIQLKLKQPNADFAAIARTDSDAKETGDRGGEVGWLSEAQLRPEIRALVLGLAKNAVSDPLKLDDGWHFVKLVDTKASYTRPLDQVRDQLIEKLRNEQTAAIRRAYVAELLKQTPPAINELALSRMLSEK